MIDGLKPYPAYKDSGVPWLGEVPGHWAVAACRHRYSQCLGKMLDAKRIRGEHLLPYLRNVDVQWDRINISNLPLMDITPAEYDRYTLKPGDLLVCEGGEVGRCAIWRGELQVCGFQKALHRLRPLSADDAPRFFYYVLRVASQLGAFTDGHESTIGHLTGDKLRAHRFAFPPLAEQMAIVRFLDHADRRIRRCTRAKRKLIALLNELKHVMIHRVATRGLDGSVRFKPSGVEWFGEIPIHWTVRLLRDLIVDGPRNGISPPVVQYGAGLESFSISAVRNGTIDVRQTDLKCVAPVKGAAAYDLRRGDILMVRGNGNIRLVGKAGLVENDMPGRIYPDILMRLRVVSTASEEFIVHFLNSPAGRQQIELAARTTVGTFKVNNQQVRQLSIALPPIDEARAIARCADEIGRRFDEITTLVGEQLALFRECRTRLVTDVVTGKLDVRQAARDLVDDRDEVEAPGEADGLGDGSDVERDDELEVAAAETADDN